MKGRESMGAGRSWLGKSRRWLGRRGAATKSAVASSIASLNPPLHDPLSAAGGQDPYREPPVRPTHTSRFGGLWTDLSNAADLAQLKLERGLIDEAEHLDVMFWIENGYALFERGVPLEWVDQLNDDIESVWKDGHDRAWVNTVESDGAVTRPLRPGDRDEIDQLTKLIDIYEYLESARRLVFAPRIRRFLEIVFETPPLAHQSLSFYRGSKQPIHQDTAFVRMSSPVELAASWIALEDVQPGSGELIYYPGSHRFDDFLFEGQYKWFPPGNQEIGRFYDQLHEQAGARGIEETRFMPKKGDVLIWAADLAHGGSDYTDSARTRKSLVTHYCPTNVYPMYFHYGRYAPPTPWRDGCQYCAAEKVIWKSG